MTAMANGQRSRPVVFKKGLEVAPILNLIVGLDQGKISFVDWRNNCFDGQGCKTDDCKDASVVFQEKTYSELNCFRSDCSVTATTKAPEGCDTQVFLTWVGRDNDRDDCTSDNYGISAFNNFSIISYIQAAWKLTEL